MKSNKTIIHHISDFLNYCEQENLKEKTQENYQRFLRKFSLWLKNNNLDSILPHQLIIGRINAYKVYLSTASLKVITQNYYLIALRAFLSYFREKGIVSSFLRKSAFLEPIKT